MLPVVIVKGRKRCVGFDQFTSLGSAVGLSLRSSSVVSVLVFAEGNDLRWRDDGSDPTSTVGMLLPKDTYWEFNGDLDKMKFIDTSTGAKLNVTYYAQEVTPN
jgi:hypothetical protein